MSDTDIELSPLLIVTLNLSPNKNFQKEKESFQVKSSDRVS